MQGGRRAAVSALRTMKSSRSGDTDHSAPAIKRRRAAASSAAASDALLVHKFENTSFGTLSKRYKRFLADVHLDHSPSEVTTCHIANPGSMRGLLRRQGQDGDAELELPESPRLLLTESTSKTRKLKFSVEALQLPDSTWVGVNTALPNRVVRSALESGVLESVTGSVVAARPEVAFGRERSRVDFVLERPDGSETLLEVKNVTMSDPFCGPSRNKVALFPDSVTARGQKHMRELAHACALGKKAAVLFFIARDDCAAFRPAAECDPAYAAELRRAHDAGVELWPCVFRIDPPHIYFLRSVPVVWPSDS